MIIMTLKLLNATFVTHAFGCLVQCFRFDW
jgi:hypothetical protein